MGATLAVVVPCFNGERFVAETLESVLVQGDDLEVIVVDDGSTDASAAVVQRVADGDHRVRLLRGPNRGVANARNAGFEARSPSVRYVLFLDADDLLVPGALGALRGRLERQPDLAAVVGTRSRIDSDGGPVEDAPIPLPAFRTERSGIRRVELGDRIGYWDLVAINPISTPGQFLVRASVLDGGTVFDQDFAPCEDWELWLRIARAGPIGVEHRHVLRYRDHESSASKRYQVMREQRSHVLEAQARLVSDEDRPRLQAAWRFAMFGYDARLRLRWARELLGQRDAGGAARNLARSVRGEVRYRLASARHEPDFDAVHTGSR